MYLRNSILILCLLLLFSACTGGGSGSPISTNTSPEVSSQTTEQSSNTTVASAAPSAQPTQPLVPQGSIWAKGRIFINGSDTNADCETLFKNIPTVQVWKKSPGQEWKLDYELSKPDPNQDDSETLTAYQCGKFGIHFSFWGPSEHACLNEDQVKLVGSYRDSNRKYYQGESPVYSCKDRENPPLILIILEPVSQPMMLAPDQSFFLMN